MEEIEWQKISYISIKSRVGTLCASLNKLIDGWDRVVIGFSEDRKIMYIKENKKGIKLSEIGGRSYGKTFSSQGLISMFGREIIGGYDLEKIEENVVILKKI
jgi:hypothetical protein